MKEYGPRVPELTARYTSSTLDTGRIYRGNIPMAQDNISSFENYKQNRQPRLEGSHRADNTPKDAAWNQQAWKDYGNIDERQARRVLEEMRQHFPQILPNGEVERPLDPRFNKLRDFMGSAYGERFTDQMAKDEAKEAQRLMNAGLFGPRDELSAGHIYDAYNTLPTGGGYGGGGSDGMPPVTGGAGGGERPPRGPRFGGRGGGEGGGGGDDFDPHSYEGTPYQSDAYSFLNFLARDNPDWASIDRLKDHLIEKISNDPNKDTAERGRELYDTLSTALQGYMRDMRGERIRRHTDPRQHFTEERIKDMLDTGPEGDQAREEEFNKMFAKADTQPTRPFQEVFNSLYDEPLYNAFIENLQTEGSKLLREGQGSNNKDKIDSGEKLLTAAQKYILEYTYRSLIHDANYLIQANLGVEQMAGFMKRFSVEMADHAFRKKGVTPALHFYEQAMMKVMAENDGYLPYRQVVAQEGERYGRVEKLARDYFDKALKAGFLKDAQGKSIAPGSMADWEIDRSMAFARGLGIITGRFVEMAAMSKLPKNKYVSMWGHVLIGELSPFRHAIGKFNLGGKRNKFLAYQLEGKRKRWDYNELNIPDNADDIRKISVTNAINGDIDDEAQILMGKVNPWQIGGAMSRSTWRETGDAYDEEEAYQEAKKKGQIIERTSRNDDAEYSIIGRYLNEAREARRAAEEAGHELDPNDDPYERIGRGVLIEKSRYVLSNPHKSKAERAKAQRVVERQLVQIANTLPLKLIYHIPEARKLITDHFSMRYRVKDPFQVKEFREALDNLAVVQEENIVNHNGYLNYDVLNSFEENAESRALTKEIAEFIKESYSSDGKPFKHLVEDFRDRKWKIPYVFGTEDVPWDHYDFIRINGRSIDRRWNDMLSASKASAATIELVNQMPFISSPADLVNGLHKIHAAVEAYDAEIAEEVVKELAEGLIWFYYKESGSRGVLGEIKAKITKKASFAEMAFGAGHMSWDELTTHDFINTLKERDMISDHEKVELMEKTKSQGRNVALRVGEYAAFIILLAIIMRVSTQSLKQSGIAA